MIFKRKTAIETQPSLTALSVIGAFARGLETYYGQWFNKIDLYLVQYIYLYAIKSDANIVRRMLMSFFHCVPYTIQSRFFDRLVSPGYDAHMVGRKKLVRDTIEQAIAEGTQHVIILGAGYDPRALLAARQYPHVTFYELDRGITRQIKLSALQCMPNNLNFEPVLVTELNSWAVTFNHNLFCLECDFTSNDLISVLTAYGYNAHEKTLVIVEGVTMYLTHKHVRQLLAFNEFFSEDSQILLSFLACMPKPGSFHRIAIDSTDEQYKTVLQPQDVLSFAQLEGFYVTKKMLFECMQTAMGNNKVAALYKKNQTLSQEHYFILQKGLSKQSINNIDDVPNITFNVV